MKWNEPLYVSESMQNKVNKVKRRIRFNAGIWNGYVITFSTNKENLLDIYELKSLKFSKYLRKNLVGLGIAKTYDEALLIVTQIIEETIENTGGTDVRTYLREERG